MLVEKVFVNYSVKIGEYSSREVKYSKNHVEKRSRFGNYELVLKNILVFTTSTKPFGISAGN